MTRRWHIFYLVMSSIFFPSILQCAFLPFISFFLFYLSPSLSESRGVLNVRPDFFQNIKDGLKKIWHQPQLKCVSLTHSSKLQIFDTQSNSLALCFVQKIYFYWCHRAINMEDPCAQISPPSALQYSFSTDPKKKLNSKVYQIQMEEK